MRAIKGIGIVETALVIGVGEDDSGSKGGGKLLVEPRYDNAGTLSASVTFKVGFGFIMGEFGGGKFSIKGRPKMLLLPVQDKKAVL